MRFHRYRANAYENDHPLQHQLDTAVVWCVHLHTKSGVGTTDALTRLESSEQGLGGLDLTGEYAETSWKEWGTEPQHENDWSLVIYYRAIDQEHALVWARHIASDALGRSWVSDHEFVVSTAGDWAEQIKI